jgi:hypothetical protein
MEGSLPDSQSLAVITLLYKNGEKADIKNWRPISLLNVDFKILAKCLANRLKKCMDTIIHPDQTCGIKGRSIFENIIFTQDAIFYANKENKPLAIVSIDQSKAFDRINRTFMLKVLKKFGFGDAFINWIKTLYTDTCSQICTNGFISETFNLERGVRQGCPLSPMLYTLTSETLLSAIRKCRDINGFQGPNGIEDKTKGYADDTAVYVRDLESVNNTITIVEKYGKASESKLNKDKTHILLCGSLKEHRPAEAGLRYVTDKIKLLGVWVGNVDTSEDNWTPIVNKISRTLGLWSTRDLTIKGKAIIVNTMALSKMWYISTVCVPPDEVIEKVEKTIQKFVLTKRLSLVKKEMLHMPEEYGGIDCLDVKMKSKALKIKWLVKIMEELGGNSLNIGRHFLCNYDKTMKGLNIITTNLKNVRNDAIPVFYQDIVKTWQVLKFHRKVPNRRALLEREFLFANTLISNNGNNLYYPMWLTKGIVQVKDIWKENNFMTVEELMRTYNIAPTLRIRTGEEYRALLDALPTDLIHKLNVREIGGEENDEARNKSLLHELYVLSKNALLPSNVYFRLMYVKLKAFEGGYKVLERAGIDRADITLEKLASWWFYLRNVDLEHKMKEFQWRISHAAVYTGVLLHEIDPDIDQNCILCRNSRDTLVHIFVNCTIAIDFWNWIFREFNFTTTLNEKFVYLNNAEHMTKLTTLLTIIGKMVIWEMRGIMRTTQLWDVAQALKLNFKYKLQSCLNTLQERYSFRNDDNFGPIYLLQNKIVQRGNAVHVNVNRQ